MRTVTILAVGKLKEPYLKEAVSEYQKRLGAYCKLQIVELEEVRLPQNPSDALISKALEEEADAIRQKLPSNSYLIALCIEGKALSSRQFADTLIKLAAQGSGNLTFLIGGSFGLAESIKAQAGLKLSLSAMTFPHHLARVLLLEQIYRALSIEAGSKYHK